MRHLLTAIIISIIASVLFMTIDWRSIDLSLSLPTFAKSSQEEQETPIQYDELADELWIDTVASTDRHSFGYSGDVTEWDGWYYDTIPVGDESVGRNFLMQSRGKSGYRVALSSLPRKGPVATEKGVGKKL